MSLFDFPTAISLPVPHHIGWLADTGNPVHENRNRTVSDTIVALVRVTPVVTLLTLVDGPTRPRHLLFATGVPAYFGVINSFE